MEKGNVRKDFFQVILLILKEQNELTGRKKGKRIPGRGRSSSKGLEVWGYQGAWCREKA